MKQESANMRIQLVKILSTVFLTIMATQTTLAQDKPLKIGVIPGPTEQVFEVVKREAAKQGLHIKVVTFSEQMVQPNVSLATGEIDANCYQYQSMVDAFNTRGYRNKLVSISKTVVFPLGIYSKKIKHLNELPQGAKISLPNDPINGGRVLLLLQKHGIIKLSPSVDAEATPLDVIENPKNIRFIELDAPHLLNSLRDVDASGINSNIVMKVGMSPFKEAIVMESDLAYSPYVCNLVVREQDKNRPEWQTLIAVYRSQVVQDFILSTFKGAIIPAWKND